MRVSTFMARKPKFPGLQQRYQTALVAMLSAQKSMSSREIVDTVTKRASEFGISQEECKDLDANFANYMARARDARVITSNGPGRGYQLGDNGIPHTDASPAAAAKPQSIPGQGANAPPTAPSTEKKRQHWESFIHLPLTVALAGHFEARVVSLPNASDQVRWGNPDMLMLRASRLAGIEDFDPSLDPDVFGLVDVTPECVLASIEIKVGLERNRAALFSAIAEAAANSRWANEAWLVFVDYTPVAADLDEDVISLARSAELGVLEVKIAADGSELEVRPHYTAPTRATLRIGELTKERVGVMREAHLLLKQWAAGTTTFFDVDFAGQKARVLVEQAIQNLRKQKGFTNEQPLAELLKPLRAPGEDDEYVGSTLRGTLRRLASASGIEEQDDGALIENICNAADEALVKKEADLVRRDLAAFRNTANAK